MTRFAIELALLFRLDGLLCRLQLRVKIFHGILSAVLQILLEIQCLCLCTHRLLDGAVHDCQLVGVVPRYSDGLLVGIENDAYLYTSLRFGDFIIPPPR